MATTGQNIIDRAWIKANDSGGAGGVRWPSAEALKWLNDGQLEIVNTLPKANPKTAQPTLQAGSRQTLAALSITDGLEVLDVVCNVSGSTRGAPITKEERAVMDINRAWHTATGSEAYHWVFDERDPKAFYIWPQVVGGKVELVYAGVPAPLASLSDNIVLDDIYANALQWFVLFSFYSKDTKFTKSMQQAAGYWELFQSSLGVRERSIITNDASGDAKATPRGGA